MLRGALMSGKEHDKEGQENFDFVMIGAGVSGLAAAMYGARLGLKTLCLGYSHGSEMPIGGVITTTNIVENYPGFIRLSGPELAEKIREHAESYELVTIREEKIEHVLRKEGVFEIIGERKKYIGGTVLFASGTKWKKLPDDVKGGKEYEGRGINFCALCDGPLYRNKIVAVVGGSDSAAKDALVLAEHAKKVYIIYRGEKIRAEPINLKRVESNSKIEIINNANVVAIKGGKAVEKVGLDRTYNRKKELELHGVFVAIGHIVLSDLARDLGVKLNEKGE